MRPARIVIVRHAEKPKKNDEPHLALRGKMRAIGLAWILPKFVEPDYIFASTSTKNSKRPYQTIHPTATFCNLKVNTDFADKETKKLVKELRKKKYAGKTVLICWHHGEMPKLIERLGQTSPYHKWPVDLFDRIIDIDNDADGEGDAGLSNLPQKLLFGDSEK